MLSEMWIAGPWHGEGPAVDPASHSSASQPPCSTLLYSNTSDFVARKPESPEKFKLCVVFYSTLGIISGFSGFPGFGKIRKHIAKVLSNTIQNYFSSDFPDFLGFWAWKLSSEMWISGPWPGEGPAIAPASHSSVFQPPCSIMKKAMGLLEYRLMTRY